MAVIPVLCYVSCAVRARAHGLWLLSGYGLLTASNKTTLRQASFGHERPSYRPSYRSSYRPSYRSSYRGGTKDTTCGTVAAVASETNVITWLGEHELGVFSGAFYFNYQIQPIVFFWLSTWLTVVKRTDVTQRTRLLRWGKKTSMLCYRVVN